MKKPKQTDPSQVRLLPPLDNLTLEDWAKICELVDARYGKRLDAVLVEEAAQ